jgi:hypothetical protein
VNFRLSELSGFFSPTDPKSGQRLKNRDIITQYIERKSRSVVESMQISVKLSKMYICLNLITEKGMVR